MHNLLGAIEDVSGALLQVSGAGLHEHTFASGVDPGAGVSWPDIVSAFDPGPERPFPGPGDITMFPNRRDQGT